MDWVLHGFVRPGVWTRDWVREGLADPEFGPLL